MSDIAREALTEAIEQRLRANPAVMLLGPRQCGKTTIARSLASGKRSHFLDLESPSDRGRLQEPMQALAPLRGLVVIDEVQRQAELFPVLRVLADRRPAPAKFLLLGSASPELVRGASESLAGRVAIVSMAGFDLGEVGVDAVRRLWWRGGFPRAYLARSDADSLAWRHDFVQTFLERDLGQLGVGVPAAGMRRLWLMAAHYHGQILNASELGRSLGHAHTTVRDHLDILCGAFVLRLLPPWFENLGKRQVKSPKLYVRDPGLLHALLGIGSFAQLEGHPKLGASWEGFALEEVLRITGDRQAFFWNTQAGAELDLLVFVGGKRFGFEFKYADAPTVSKSMHIARADLKLERLFVVHPGATSWPLADWCEAVGIRDLHARLGELAGPRRRGAKGGVRPRRRRTV